MIAAKPCFPRAPIGVPGYSLCLPWASPGTREAPEADVYGLDTGLCRKPSWEVHSHSACYRGHLVGQEGVSVGRQAEKLHALQCSLMALTTLQIWELRFGKARQRSLECSV